MLSLSILTVTNLSALSHDLNRLYSLLRHSDGKFEHSLREDLWYFEAWNRCKDYCIFPKELFWGGCWPNLNNVLYLLEQWFTTTLGRFWMCVCVISHLMKFLDIMINYIWQKGLWYFTTQFDLTNIVKYVINMLINKFIILLLLVPPLQSAFIVIFIAVIFSHLITVFL